MTTCLLPFSGYCADFTPKNVPEKASVVSRRSEETKGQVVNSTKTEYVKVIGLNHLQTIDKISGTNNSTINKKADLGPLGNVNLQNVPFSVMKTPHSVIMNQQVRSIDKATEYMPSVQMEARSDPALTRMVNRGFESDIVANSRIDGMNVLLMTPYATEQFKNVTVLNGMAGAIYGPENPAGVFEMTQKRPTNSPYLNLNFNYDSQGAPMESLDGSYSMGPVAVRLNMLNQTGTGYVSGSHEWRDMISGNIDIHLTKKTVLELDASQYSMGLHGYPGYFSIQDGTKIPDAPSLAHGGYGQRSAGGDYSTSMGMAKLKHEFNDHWRLKLGGLYQDSSRNVFTVNNNVIANGTVVNGKTVTCGGSVCDQQTISTPANGQDFQTWSNSAYLNGEFNTGAVFGQKITHHINIGSNGYSLDNFAPTSVDPKRSLGTSPFDDPNPNTNVLQTRKYGNHRAAHIQQQSLVVGDSIDFGKYITVMSELSWGWIRQENWKWKNNSNQYTSGQKANAAFSPSVGVVVHPIKAFSVYFNWGQSVQAGPIAGAGSNINTVLPIIHSEQFEGGVKYTYKDRLQFNLDGFTMNRPYAYLNTQTNIEGLYGKQRETGVEFQVSGKVTKDLSILGGVTWLHSSLGKMTAGKANNQLIHNAAVVGVPQWSADFMLDYRVPVIKQAPMLHGLAFNTNVHYVGRRAANLQGTDFASGYVTLNLGARYTAHIYNHALVFRFNVDNVTGEKYWGSIFANGPASGGVGKSGVTASAGMPRTWHLGSSIYF